MTRTHHSDILGMALDFDRAKGEIMITTTFIKTMKKFVDENECKAIYQETDTCAGYAV